MNKYYVQLRLGMGYASVRAWKAVVNDSGALIFCGKSGDHIEAYKQGEWLMFRRTD